MLNFAWSGLIIIKFNVIILFHDQGAWFIYRQPRIVQKTSL